MNTDQTLLKSSIKLVQLLDKTADEALPEKIADVVKLHSKLSVASAWIPVPGADVAAGAAAIWGMYIRINNKINLTLADNVMKTIGSGVATNLAAYAVGTGVASALKFIPGIGTIGGALIMSATQYALTMASGWIYLQALIALAERGNGSIDTSKLGDAIKEMLKEKSVITDFINSAKKDYKK